jgi:NAD(P)-dependent dehydrogenase (short-subunit alcohol dehydrogenase family)
MARALVTGANRGIGLELCRQLAERGSEVIAACRESSKELDALAKSSNGKVRVETGIEVTTDESVKKLATKVEGQLDLLVLNAGILLMGGGVEAPDFEVIRKQLEVNALGPLRVASALVPNLGKGSKIAVITSRMGSIADNGSGGMYGYRMSKAAVNMAAVSLANDLKSRGVAVAILHPGMVKTDMTAGHGQIEPADAVRGLLARIDALTMESTGTFWHANGERLPW